MRRLYGRMSRTTVLWAILLSSMTAMAGTSAAVFAVNEFQPHVTACSGSCQVDAQGRGRDSTCSCGPGGTCGGSE